MEEKIFLETAEKIGDRLVATAAWSDESCTWIINAPDRKNRESRKSVNEQADVGIYQGVSGIVLFLLEVYKITGGTKLREMIEAALKFVKQKSQELPNNNFAFHGGRVGVGYTFYEAYKAFQKEEYLKIGQEILKPLEGNESKDTGLDVIAGAAGAIPALLKMSEISEDEFKINMAISLGENLIKKARFEPTGWSWDGGNAHVRNLCGYAHGAAGFGHAFIELYNYTGKEKYLYAAEQTFMYERQFFNEKELNWPDFRYSDLSNFIYEQRMDELTEILKKGELPPYELKYMSAWCHGSPGIALSRLRAYDVTGIEAYKKEAELAVEGTKKTLSQGYNYSLCHGIGGNCEALIYAEEILGDTHALSLAEGYAKKGIEEFEKQDKPWTCGTMGGVSDPSLMLGKAGIGYFLLSLYSKNIDSVLIVHPSTKNKSSSNQEGLEELREGYTDKYFLNTKKYFKAVGNELKSEASLDIKKIIGRKESDVEFFYKSIKEYNATLAKEEKNKFEDFFKLEEKRYLQTMQIKDFTKEYQESLIRRESEQINWSNVAFCLSKTSTLIRQKFNWSEWLDKANENRSEEPVEDEENYLLYKQNNKYLFKHLNSFLSLLLCYIQEIVEFQNLINKIKRDLKSNVNENELRELVKQQLIVSYEAGLIEIVNK